MKYAFRVNQVFLLLFLLIAGCGGNSSSPSPDPNLLLDDTGFPNIAGLYSFLSSDVNETCTDGTTGNFGPLVQNVRVNQSVNAITLTDNGESSSGLGTGVTVIEASTATGNVDIDGSFVATRNVTAVSDQGLNLRFRYTIRGNFSSTGWSGEVGWITTSPDFIGSCSSQATFSGRLLEVGG